MGSLAISEEEVKSLMTAMKKRYDLDFTNYETSSLCRGVTRLMAKHKISAPLDLWSRVLNDDDFFLNSIDDLMINLTELFRNPEAWVGVRKSILENLKYKQNLKVWHAGCSTGEEVYTMAMILDDCGLLDRSDILATDLSKKALAQAQSGEYSIQLMNKYAKSFKKFFPKRILEDFFDLDTDIATIKPRYKRNVTYQQHNLVSCDMTDKFDIIFCRNVLIYFDGVLKQRIINFLESCLTEDGYLVLGFYDTIPQRVLEVFDVKDQSSRIYKKKVKEIIKAI
ncbi:CheR family methyltransferase [Marinoscillum pacificum]|uniref:CheR family methyltransferase n=1 Tax=Marinoscillum pacificum TaxID=392723 RepID=UPI0021571550|nr:protein-glutamate O-methyltransferase CheR [Marinoscillum pacificum]